MLLRVDGGAEMGMGHVMESLALAAELRRQYGADVHFVMRDLPEGVAAVRDAGWKLTRLPRECDKCDEAMAWRRLVCEQQPAIAVANLQEPTDELLDSLRLPGLPLACVVNTDAALAVDCRIDVTAHPELMPVDPAFTELGATRQLRETVERLFISFGGSDPFDLTGRVVGELLDDACALEIDVILGPAYGDGSALHERCVAANIIVRLHQNIPLQQVARCMAKADIAITAGGDMMYELAAVGAPSISLCPLPRHAAVAEVFVRHDAVISLGVAREVQAGAVAGAVRSLVADWPQRQLLSAAGRALIDGRGAARQVALLEPWLLKRL